MVQFGFKQAVFEIQIQFLVYFSPTSHLRSQVLRCSTEGLHGGSVSDAFFAEAEVCDLDVAVFVQHEVLQLMRRTRESLDVFPSC